MNATKPRLYNTEEAAAYLGVKVETLRYHLTKDHLRPDYQMGMAFAFTRESLDAYLKKYQSEDALTIAEAAAYLGIAVSAVRYHVYKSGKLKPDAMRGNAMAFTIETLERFRQR